MAVDVARLLQEGQQQSPAVAAKRVRDAHAQGVLLPLVLYRHAMLRAAVRGDLDTCSLVMGLLTSHPLFERISTPAERQGQLEFVLSPALRHFATSDRAHLGLFLLAEVTREGVDVNNATMVKALPLRNSVRTVHPTTMVAQQTAVSQLYRTFVERGIGTNSVESQAILHFLFGHLPRATPNAHSTEMALCISDLAQDAWRRREHEAFTPRTAQETVVMVGLMIRAAMRLAKTDNLNVDKEPHSARRKQGIRAAIQVAIDVAKDMCKPHGPLLNTVPLHGLTGAGVGYATGVDECDPDVALLSERGMHSAVRDSHAEVHQWVGAILSRVLLDQGTMIGLPNPARLARRAKSEDLTATADRRTIEEGADGVASKVDLVASLAGVVPAAHADADGAYMDDPARGGGVGVHQGSFLHVPAAARDMMLRYIDGITRARQRAEGVAVDTAGAGELMQHVSATTDSGHRREPWKHGGAGDKTTLERELNAADNPKDDLVTLLERIAQTSPPPPATPLSNSPHFFADGVGAGGGRTARRPGAPASSTMASATFAAGATTGAATSAATETEDPAGVATVNVISGGVPAAAVTGGAAGCRGGMSGGGAPFVPTTGPMERADELRRLALLVRSAEAEAAAPRDDVRFVSTPYDYDADKGAGVEPLQWQQGAHRAEPALYRLDTEVVGTASGDRVVEMEDAHLILQSLGQVVDSGMHSLEHDSVRWLLAALLHACGFVGLHDEAVALFNWLDSETSERFSRLQLNWALRGYVPSDLSDDAVEVARAGMDQLHQAMLDAGAKPHTSTEAAKLMAITAQRWSPHSRRGGGSGGGRSRRAKQRQQQTEGEQDMMDIVNDPVAAGGDVKGVGGIEGNESETQIAERVWLEFQRLPEDLQPSPAMIVAAMWQMCQPGCTGEDTRLAEDMLRRLVESNVPVPTDAFVPFLNASTRLWREGSTQPGAGITLADLERRLAHVTDYLSMVKDDQLMFSLPRASHSLRQPYAVCPSLRQQYPHLARTEQGLRLLAIKSGKKRIYNAMLRACAFTENSAQAFEVLAKFQSNALRVDASQYAIALHAMVKGHARTMEEFKLALSPVRVAQWFLADYVRSRVPVDSTVVRNLLALFHKATEVAKYAEDADAPPPTVYMDRALEWAHKLEHGYTGIARMEPVRKDGEIYASLIGICVRAHRVQKATELIEEMRKRKVKIGTQHYQHIIEYYTSVGNDMHRAMLVFHDMVATDVQPDARIVDNMVRGFVTRSGEVDEAITFVQDVFNQFGVRPAPVTLAKLYCHSLTDASVQETARSRAVIDQLYATRPRPKFLTDDVLDELADGFYSGHAEPSRFTHFVW